ncbi:asparaginase [Rhizobium sp. P40RR-XXII]|uniref:asparaginase n=1 Tax=Rhizobium sp. P40RR-XXII TaxID=2726739 RepID=UPI00145661C9|nr:asparaginase [Rhizobium sp. P40RR-XXII]NLS20331.1 asparaginase [Rhizobium sp. P40RR-XXII]
MKNVVGFGHASVRIDDPKLVVVLATGGTIAQDGARTATIGVETLLQLSGIDREVECLQLMQVTSPNIRPEHWLVLAEQVAIVAARPDVSGVVITHGTDTLEETAFFLDLTYRGTKPIVIVGAMRPSHSLESDGPLNLRHAIMLARSPEARNRGVLTVLNARVQAARDVTKRHSVDVDAFDSPNIGDVGAIENDKPRVAAPLDALPHFLLPSALPPIPVIYAYAGQEPETLSFLASARPPGLVFAGTGGGSIPDAILPTVQRAAQEGTIVVRSSRTGAGAVARNAEVDDDANGFVAAGTLNPQKARVLLMLCVAAGFDTRRTQEMFAKCSGATEFSTTGATR